MLKAPVPGSELLLQKVQEALGPNRAPLLIGIDGANGIGKTSVALWLGWQLGVPVAHLDLYAHKGTKPLRFMTDELKRIIEARILCQQPIIVEGCFLLDALDQIGQPCDFLIYVQFNAGGSLLLSNMLTDYRSRRKPEARAQFKLDGYDEKREMIKSYDAGRSETETGD